MQIAKSKLKQLIKEEIVNVKVTDTTASTDVFDKLVECAEHLAKGDLLNYKRTLKQLNALSTEV